MSTLMGQKMDLENSITYFQCSENPVSVIDEALIGDNILNFFNRICKPGSSKSIQRSKVA